MMTQVRNGRLVYGRLRKLLELTLSLAWRDIASRYRGANLGLLWTVLNPLLMLAVYGLAFGYVFRAKWPGLETSADFVRLLFIGIAIHGFFAECLTRSPGSIASNPSFVKKVVFPLGIIPPVTVLVALFNFFAILVVFLIVQLVLGEGWSWHYLLLPAVLVPMFLLGLALSYLLSFLGVYFKDINQIVPSVSTVLLFVSSAIVPVSTLPPEHQRWFLLNPITFYIDQSRQALLWEQPLDWGGLASRTLIGLVLLAASVYLFRRARRGFADVI